MSTKQLVEREKSLGRIAGIIGIAGVLMTLVPPIAGLGTDFNKLAQDAYADRLVAFEAARDDLLLSQIIQAVGILLFTAPLLFLFEAAAARSAQVRRALVGLTIIGPICLAISLILYFVAYDSVASSFIDNYGAGTDANEAAKDALTGETAYSIFGGLQIAGLLALVVAVVYTSLQAMRVGLLTRFVGTLGMALGAGFVFIGPLSLSIFVLVISPLIAGFWVGPRPPAWDAGEAIPWPKAGETPVQQPEQLADPDEFEDDDGDGLPDGAPERPARRDNKKKRKRKQRG
jgi:hypothetical protein